MGGFNWNIFNEYEESIDNNNDEKLNVKMRILGYYNFPNQKMYPEPEKVEEASKLAPLFEYSINSLLINDKVDSKLKQVIQSPSVFIFEDENENLYAYYTKNKTAKLTNVVYDVDCIKVIQEQLKVWFYPGKKIEIKKNNNINIKNIINVDKSSLQKEKKVEKKYNSEITSEDRAYSIKDECGVEFNKSKTKIIDAPREIEYYEIPRGVKIIGFSAFMFCGNLKEIKIPDTVECIGWNAFCDCRSLERIEIPNSVVRIEGEAFRACTLLKHLHIPYNTRFIGPNPIANCPNSYLTSSSPYYVVENCTLFNKNKTTIISYWGDENDYHVPNNVYRIMRSAFNHCSSIQRVYFSDKLQYVDNNAFYYCQNLEEVYMNDSLENIDSFAFCGCHNLKKIDFSSNIKQIDVSVFSECIALEKVELPQNVTKIYYDAFKGCEALEKVILPQNLTYIGGQAFQSCKSLEEISFPGNLKKIAEKAFRFCNNLRELWFYGTCPPEIGERAFRACHIEYIHVLENSNKTVWRNLFPNVIIIDDIKDK